jgi:hypothetical protein
VADIELGNVLLTALREIIEMQDDNTPQTDADFEHLPGAKYVVLGLGEGRLGFKTVPEALRMFHGLWYYWSLKNHLNFRRLES